MNDFMKYLDKKKIISTHEAMKFVGHRSALTRLAEKGAIQKLGGGYYADNSVEDMVAGLMVASKYYKVGVISSMTALRVHDMTDNLIHEIDIDIPNTTNIKNSLLNVHRVAPRYLTGTMVIDYMGANIKVYTPARCLYEAYKYSGFGHDFFKALKHFIRKYYESTPAGEIEKLDELFGIDVSSRISQEMADEF